MSSAEDRYQTIHVTHAAEAIAVLLDIRRHSAFLFRGQRDRDWPLGVAHKIGDGWENTPKAKTEEKGSKEDKIAQEMKDLEDQALADPSTAQNDGVRTYWKSKSVHKKIDRILQQFIKHSEHEGDNRIVYPCDAPSRHLKSEQWWRNLFFAHHYGLNTALLDWTTNPLVALYFAVENSITDLDDKEDIRGAVYAIKVKGNPGESDMPGKRWHNFDEVFRKFPLGEFCPFWIMINPPRTTDRIVRQSGKFSYHPSVYDHVLLDSKNDKWGGAQGLHKDDEALIKVVIGDGRTNPTAEIRRALRIMNIHRASLFPDFDGVAAYLNDEWNDMVSRDEDVSQEGSSEVSGCVKTVQNKLSSLFPDKQWAQHRESLEFDNEPKLQDDSGQYSHPDNNIEPPNGHEDDMAEPPEYEEPQRVAIELECNLEIQGESGRISHVTNSMEPADVGEKDVPETAE